MRLLRTMSTARLFALLIGAVAAAAATAAIALAATSGGGRKPPPEPLAKAVRDAIGAPTVQGVSARAKGTHLLFQDDDDQYADGAIAEMRRFAREQPDRIGIFRMRYPDGHVLWADPELRYKNVSTQTFLVPNVPGKLGVWKNDGLRDGDYCFIEATVALQGDPVFCDHVVTYVRSDRRPVRRRVHRLIAPLSRLRFRTAPRTRLRRALGRLP